MFSAGELNSLTGIAFPKYKIVDWHPSHVAMLKMNKYDQAWYDNYDNYEQILASACPKGYAFTGIGEGVVACCFGFTRMWNGVYEAWLIPTTENIRKYVFPFHRASMRIIDEVMSKPDINRLQITVSSENALALEWAKRCYFKNEGVLHKYGPEGSNYLMMARY